MKVSVMHHFCEHRGDHGADVAHVHDLRPGETVEALVERLIVVPKRTYKTPLSEWIVLKVVAAPEEGATDGD